MSKNVMLNDGAYAALLKHKRQGESLSDVVKRFVPPPIRTFGDLEKHLQDFDGPLNIDFAALDRLRKRKQKGARGTDERAKASSNFPYLVVIAGRGRGL